MDPNGEFLSVTESLEQAYQVFQQVINQALTIDDTILEKIDSLSDQNLYKPFVKAAYMIMIAILSMDKTDVDRASEAVEKLSKMSNKMRRKGFAVNVFKIVRTPNYNKYSELEAHAEMIHAFSIAMKAAIYGINTYNFYGLIKVVYRLQKFLQNFDSSKKIKRMKTNWESQESAENYEAGIQLANGICHLVVSNIPPKILKVANFFGYRGVEATAFYCINRTAFELSGIFSGAARLFLTVYWLYIEPHTWGAKNLQMAQQILDMETKTYPDSIIYKLFSAKLVEVSGQMDTAINQYKSLIAETEGIAHKVLYFELMWCHALKSDWTECARYAERVRLSSTHSPAYTTYVEAIFWYVLSIETNDQEMKQKASELFRTVPTLRIRHLGQTITPEKIAIVQSEKYFKCDEFLILPEIDLLYQGNWLSFIKGDNELLARFMNKVEASLKKYKPDLMENDDLDNYLASIFYKGILFKLMGKYEQAKKCFTNILEEDARIGREYSLPPQAMCELGLLEVERGNTEEAHKWLTGALNNYNHYLNENYVHVKACAGLREIGVSHSDHTTDHHNLKEYQNQWLKQNNVNKNEFDTIVGEEEKVDMIIA